ncbi:hypothetical protein LBMAG53_13040 [Planctomycetota bacterium]|nr:hypothetical protein LBMAG53_13040 [Planctomycetota bacterium]
MIGWRAALAALALASGFVAAEPDGSANAAPSEAEVRAVVTAALDQARDLAQAGRWPEAAAVLERARKLAPGNAALANRIAQVDLVLSDKAKVPADRSPEDRDTVAEQAAIAEARVTALHAESLAASGRSEAAAAVSAGAEARLIAADHSGAAKALAAELAARRSSWEAASRSEAAEAGAKGRAGAVAKAGSGRKGELAGERAGVDERLSRILELHRRGLDELALARCRQMRSDFPDDQRVAQLFAELFEAVHTARRHDLDERRRLLRQEVAEQIERSLIPSGFDGRPRYPEDWQQRRGASSHDLLDLPPAEEWRERLMGALSIRVTFSADNQDGAAVLRNLAAQGGINLIIAPEVVASGDRPVSLAATDMTLANAIGWVTTLMATNWAIADGAVYVGKPPADLTVLRVHDAGAAVFPAKDQTLNVQGGFGGGAGGGGGGGGFQLFGANDPGAAAAKGLTPDDLVDTIRRSVMPKVWEDPANSIVVRNTLLVVTAPVETQRLIAQFLRAQERAASLQVRIDLRSLILDDGLIEEIGVQWNNLAGSLLATPTGYGFSRAASSLLWQGLTSNTLPGAAIDPPAPATSGTGLVLQSTMLRNADFSAILTAVERTKRGTVLAEVDVTTVNGVRASTFFGTQFAYIADYDIVGNNLDPRIEILTFGTGIDIKPLISADRRTVTLEVSPTITDVAWSSETMLAPRVLPGEDGQQVGPPVPFPLDLVNRQVRSGSTTLKAVPDRATVLIGGLGKTIEQQAATRVPFFGTIPFLGRLFGQRARWSQRTQFYLLATATIVDYDALEAQL